MPSLFAAKGQWLTRLFYHRDLFHLGGIHKESLSHDCRTSPKITVYSQSAYHCLKQRIGIHTLLQLTFHLYRCGSPAGAAPVECLIKKI